MHIKYTRGINNKKQFYDFYRGVCVFVAANLRKDYTEFNGAFTGIYKMLQGVTSSSSAEDIHC